MTPRELGIAHGTNAHNDGKICVPHMDANVGLYIEMHEHREIIAYLHGWLHGWNTTNLQTATKGATK